MKKWLKNAIFYEIYPQTFRDSNADGIGDFNGICEKLDYIKDVGFTAIWMNPCFKSPFTDAGYDVEDYYTAAPRYGTNEDLKRLFDEVHKRGMHMILDLVPGHTATTCEWFKKSMQPEKNQYSDRYIWTDHIGHDCAGCNGLSGSIRGISARNGCCAVNYYSTQPALNYGFGNITEPWQCAPNSEAALATRAEVINIIKFWLGLGCDELWLRRTKIKLKQLSCGRIFSAKSKMSFLIPLLSPNGGNLTVHLPPAMIWTFCCNLVLRTTMTFSAAKIRISHPRAAAT